MVARFALFRQLLVEFTSKIDFGLDFEQALNFFVDVRRLDDF